MKRGIKKNKQKRNKDPKFTPNIPNHIKKNKPKGVRPKDNPILQNRKKRGKRRKSKNNINVNINIINILDTPDIKIDVTAGLPTYKNKNILWLALESLCRQKTQYNWELVVGEESGQGSAGEEYIKKYKDRLQNAGCKRIIYIEINKHIPLSKKWAIIANNSKGSSFLLSASDDYSSPDRIEISHKKMLEGYNWFDVRRGLFLHLQSFNSATYVGNPKNTGLFICIKTRYLKNLRGPWKGIGVDGWLNKRTGNRKKYKQESPLLGLCTDGANTLSHYRKKMYLYHGNYRKPFSPPKQSINDILPKEIIQQLENKFKKNNFKNNKIKNNSSISRKIKNQKRLQAHLKRSKEKKQIKMIKFKKATKENIKKNETTNNIVNNENWKNKKIEKTKKLNKKIKANRSKQNKIKENFFKKVKNNNGSNNSIKKTSVKKSKLSKII